MVACVICESPKVAPYLLTQRNDCVLVNDLKDYRFWDHRRSKRSKKLSCRCKRAQCPTLQFCKRQPKSLPKTKISSSEDIQNLFRTKKLPDIPFTENRCEDIFNVYGSVAEDWINNYFKSLPCEKKPKQLADSKVWVDAHSQYYKEKVSPPPFKLESYPRPLRKYSITTNKSGGSMRRRSSRRRQSYAHRFSVSVKKPRSSVFKVGSAIVNTPFAYHMPFSKQNIFSYRTPKSNVNMMRPDGSIQLEKDLEYPIYVTEPNHMLSHLKNKFLKELRGSLFNVPGAIKKINLFPAKIQSARSSHIRFKN